jgi:hypothetical protein
MSVSPIPVKLVQAFRNAIAQLDAWRWGGPEPVVRLNGEGFGSIGAIADFASTFNDPMPADIYRRLCGLSELGDEPPEDQTFEGGGQYLRKAYDELVSRRARARIE